MNIDYRTAHYILAVAGALEDGERIDPEAMTDRCPECGEVQTLLDCRDHVVMRRSNVEGQYEVFVVIGCEGYWVLDPKPLGVPGDNSTWQDWRIPPDDTNAGDFGA